MYAKFDVVIVGAGGAGLMAAMQLPNASVAVLSKVYPIRSHTGAAQGGVAAALGNLEEDHWKWHMYDTVKGGDYLVDQPAAEILAREAIDAVYELEHRGLPFNRTPDGRIDQRRFGGHTRNFGEGPVRRSCYAADRTGHMILQTMYQNAVKNQVRFFNEYLMLDLLINDGQACGVVALEIRTGEIHTFHAKAVLFATGGYGRAWRVTSNAFACTGDGMAIAYRRGIPLQDMEMYQFHPTGICKGGVPLSVEARVVIDPQWTPLPGFYAAGEVACVSVHGANRLGTNSLVDLIVFGRRAGKHMAKFIAENNHAPLPDEPEAYAREMVSHLYTSTGGESAARVRSTLQNEMDDRVFVERSEKGMVRALDTLDGLQDAYQQVQLQDKGKRFNTELVEAIELGFLLDCSEATIHGALARKESRGAHFRLDYQKRDDVNWLKHTLAYKGTKAHDVRLDYKDVILIDDPIFKPKERKY